MRHSLRAKFWDYESEAIYFVTFKTKDNSPFLGTLVKGACELTECGKLVEQIIFQLHNQFDYIHLIEFIIMPDHVHLLCCLNHEKREYLYPEPNNIQPDTNLTKLTNRLDGVLSTNETNKLGGICGANNPMLQKSLGHIMRWLKGRTSFECRKINKEFGWQSNYHDRIVRSEYEMKCIQNYILENPTKAK